MTKRREILIRSNPFRAVGQVLSRRCVDWSADGLLWLVVLPAFFLTVASLEWWRAMAKVGPHPIFFTGLAAVTAVWAGARWRTRAERGRFNLGADGERAVSVVLEDLGEAGFALFHDVRAEGINLGHVVVGPTGVFVIETKTVGKRPDRQEEVIWDGRELTLSGRPLWGDPVGQARDHAHWLAARLSEMSGVGVTVIPVVVFPGWWVDRRAHCPNLHVLNHREIPHTLRCHPGELPKETVAQLRSQVAQLARGE